MDMTWILFVALTVPAALLIWWIARRREPQSSLPGDIKGAPPARGSDLSERLSPTRGNLLKKLGRFMGPMAADSLTTGEWDLLEEALLEGDVGVSTTALLKERMRGAAKAAAGVGIKDLLGKEAQRLLEGPIHGEGLRQVQEKPIVISVVGVNGAGKTTTVGKLAKRFTSEGKTVLAGAVDTFRAAAISQLKVWADRAGAQFVTGREGADPGAVAFDSVTAGRARGVDIVLLDTAGRLHTKTDLMDELKKVHRVVKKVLPEAPHEVWLVLDGTTGQNAISQAREFQKALDLTGVIVTKLDGTAKGGAILAIAAELKLPVKYIGVGESAEDLVPFVPRAFVDAILGGSP